MKRIIFWTSLVFVLVANLSCKKDKTVEFDIDYTSNVTIPSTGVTVNVPADFQSPEISTNSKNKFTEQETVQNLVDEIKLSRFNLSVSSGDLNFVKSLNVYLKTTGMGDVLIATKTTIPQGVSSFGMDLQDVNIKEYIFNDKIQFRVTVTIQTGLSNNQDLKIDQSVHVKAKLSKKQF